MEKPVKSAAQKPDQTQPSKPHYWRRHPFLTSFVITVLFFNYARDPNSFYQYIRGIPGAIFDWRIDTGITVDNVISFFVNSVELIGLVIIAAIIFGGPIVLFVRWEHQSQLKEMLRPYHFPPEHEQTTRTKNHPPRS